MSDHNPVTDGGTLYMVATPLGNLEDWSDRAREVVRRADLVAAEDTRHSRRLLAAHGMDRPMVALHEHNEASRAEELVAELAAGKSVAVIADAGTPLVSDPGYRMVCAAHDRGVAVSPVPGPSAVTAALSVAGLPSDVFCFRGFPPAKVASRREMFRSLISFEHTSVFFESCHRIKVSLTDMQAAFGAERLACVARELTKLHEQVVRGSLGELVEQVQDGTIPARGEFVVLIAGASSSSKGKDETPVLRLLELLVGEMAPSRAAKVAARYFDLPRRRCFELAEQLNRNQPQT